MSSSRGRPCPQNYKFNGKERDTESGLDNFGARYDSSNLGRFMTPDWAARPTTVPYAVFGDPQSLNLYGFVRNDPVSLADADGHDGGALSFEQIGASSQNEFDDFYARVNGSNGVPPTETSGRPQTKIPELAQNQSQTQTQQKPGEEHKGDPYSLKPEGSRDAGNGAKFFSYQVVDPTGKPVSDVSVQEHVKVVAAENVNPTVTERSIHYPTTLKFFIQRG